MSPLHGSKARLLGNGIDLSGWITSITQPASAEALDSTTLNKTSKTYVPGLHDATISAEGFGDFDEEAADEILSAALGTEAGSLLVYCPAGYALGAPAIGVDADYTSYELDSPVDGLTAFSLEAQSSVGRETGKVQHTLGAEVATGNDAGVDGGAATTEGGFAYLQVSAASEVGDESLTVKVQHSADDITYADLISFDAVAAAPGAQRKEVAGSVNQYTRTTRTIAGSNPSFTYLAAFGRY